MSEQTSVVTPERFSSGLTYKDYIAQIKVNKDRFDQYYQSVEVSPDDADFFKKAVEAGVTKMLVLGEDWCPDVYRGMPVAARISEASGMELRVFPRDENLDIMNEFLKDGEFQSIPTVVLYTNDHDYLGHWIERPAKANEERVQIEAEVKQEMSGSSDEEVRNTIRERTTARFPAWQQESVKEIRQLISDKAGV